MKEVDEMEAYDLSIPLGPMHPAFKEPLRVKLKTEGEVVVGAEVDLGYVHRGIENIMKGKPWQKAVFLAERVCGICSNSHNLTFIETLEKISDVEIPERAKYLRLLAQELNRLHSHILANLALFLAVEHETLAMMLLNVRERVLDCQELLCGNRVILSYNVVGGVRFDATPSILREILAVMDEIEPKLRRYYEMFEHGPMLRMRTEGIGYMSKREAELAPAVGPIARGSGVRFDWRMKHPDYQDILNFKPVWREEGDARARYMVRFDEIFECIKMIRYLCENIPEGEIRKRAEVKKGEAIHTQEAPRGDLTYFIRTDSFGRIEDITIRTPTIPNLGAFVKYMLRNSPTVADAVVIYASIDPCIACLER
ncbi:MAG: energy-converting hydrogenase subunit [Archaeoglobi archaeon]|nr:energy-converting hydrogenase subunit [Archaeoglobi archaeon]